jgi:hypothetical protein
MPAASSETIHNEQVKLFAAALDRASTTSWALGVLAPLATAFYNPPALATGLWPTVLGTICWMLLATILHLEAQSVLRKLVAL